MGETTAVAHGGDPQDRAAFPRPRCIAVLTCVKLPKVPLLPAPCSLFQQLILLLSDYLS
ncbi:hypothetical protein [Moorena producens]|uniref:hypothetical protein n=1 Tax=Moorena producens TaxID=1155739 RepID=UPI003C782FFB